MEMFCYQCEQTCNQTGCTKFGICGKDPKTAAMQDLLVQVCKDIAFLAGEGPVDGKVDTYLAEGLFTTITNVNFDAPRIADIIRKGVEIRNQLAEESDVEYEMLNIEGDDDRLAELAAATSIPVHQSKSNETVAGLQELILYGLKGSAAYADHARLLGVTDAQVDADFRKHLAFLATEPTDIDALLGNALSAGELNLRVMELLDRANTGKYGHPEPTAVRVTPVAGKCILVSGHDLADLEALLKQTEGRGIKRIYPRRNAPMPGLSRVEEVLPPCRQLRRGMARSGEGIRRLPRRHPDDYQLHPEAPKNL